jgi:K(+)-stimulated pyrophosphate-energized sodium pump
MSIDFLYWSGIVGAVLAIGFALVQYRRVMSHSEGNETMVKIAAAVRSGAGAYLKRQYTTLICFFLIMAAILGVLSVFGLVNRFIPFAFLTGGFFTGLAGFLGMKAATNANARTANAAQQGLNKGLRVAFSSGTVMGFVVAGFGLLDVSGWYLMLVYVFKVDTETIASTMLTFGMGVASMSMFARVGGGIFTKAADVGADLVGKVEAGIPEDDARNPAVIADNVGDNVGDVAGMGADLYESYSNALVATFAIGVSAGYGRAGLLLALLIASVGIVASIIGTFFVRTREHATQENLLRSLHAGTFIAGGVSALTTLPLVLWVAHNPGSGTMGQHAWGIFGSIVVGLASGFIIAYFTEVYTSVSHKPTRELSEATETGTAMVMIGGISLGMKSSVAPIITVSAAVILSYIFSGGLVEFNAGLYGIGLSAVGMLATLSITLACDAYGPVADNAGGIAQMAGLPHEVRERTDALDSLGNTTAAIGKGFAIGSTGFTAIALLVSYVNLTQEKLAEVGKTLDLSLTNPPMLIGLFLGAAVVFLFAALTMGAVHRAAQNMVKEVRRQFREIKGIMDGTGTPDYKACVDICTRGAQREMIAPGLLVILAPVVTGFFLGITGVVGLLTGVIVAGFPMAVFMLTSGGAWDNAKKYIENGNFGGKGSENHKSAVIGDTVGDPFKDTTGPSFNLLITLSSTVAIVFSSVTVAFSLWPN